jgi:hypothetical protein
LILVQLWVKVWGGWNGYIYIASAKKLPNFSPARKTSFPQLIL